MGTPLCPIQYCHHFKQKGPRIFPSLNACVNKLIFMRNLLTPAVLKCAIHHCLQRIRIRGNKVRPFDN
ncbi:hypothetical protein FGO68_gene17186 [Halteria grandinella]|uniref:Uncharacterized protein n=1 Tax=Halteria grandinella TaxID=5974 RepID=A0A8J8P8T4_HALGN|nr:hypothetical protein FGO68_gene17186 [Halteria grandinella]